MTTPRLTKRRTSLEKHADEVIAFLLNGWTWQRVAEKYSVSKNAVMKFQARHVDRLEALQAVVAKQVEDYAVAEKVNRIAELQWWYDQTKAEAEKDGLTIVEQVLTVSKDGAETTTITKDYRAAMVREARGILHQVAEELAQLPKASVNINTGVQVVIRDYGGFDPE